MHEFKAEGKVLIEITLKTSGQFNGNYRSGQEEAEDALVDEALSVLPTDFKGEVKDVTVTHYEQTTAEREVEHD
jgi:hypothetical protein